jgi:hypothetical protein
MNCTIFCHQTYGPVFCNKDSSWSLGWFNNVWYSNSYPQINLPQSFNAEDYDMFY